MIQKDGDEPLMGTDQECMGCKSQSDLSAN